MLKTVVNFLNLKLGLLNYFDLTRCLCELKTESGDDGITAPKEYVSDGNWDNIDFDAFDGVSYWRLRDEITTSPLENAYKAGKRIETTVPLKLVFSVRRDKLTADDAYSYDRIRQTIVKQFNIDDGALKTSLGAEKVVITSPTANGDAKEVWDGETDNTGTFEPKYEVVFGSVDIDVVIISKGECLTTECDDADSDILHAFDFCSAAVRDRLTQTQVDCLIAAYGGSCDPVTEQINGVTIGTSSPGDTNNQLIQDSAGASVGTEANPSVVGDASVTVNSAAFDTVVAEGSIDVPVEYENGTPVGTITGGVVEIPNVIEVTMVISDTTPDFGDTITITATPTNIVPTSYLFFAWRSDTDEFKFLQESASNVCNWTTDVVNTWSVHVIADDGVGQFSAACQAVTIAPDTDAEAWLDFVSIPDDGTIYFSGTSQEVTGAQYWYYVNALVFGLKADGLWSSGHYAYLFIGGDVDIFKINLFNPADTDAAFRAEFNGGWLINELGITANATNTYADTHFNPNTHLAANDGAFVVYTRVSQTGSVTGYDWGAFNSGTGAVDALASKITSNRSFYGMGALTQVNGIAVSDLTGCHIITRDNDSANQKWIGNDGTVLANSPTAFVGHPSYSEYIGGVNLNGSIALYAESGTNYSLMGRFDGLSDAQATSLRGRIDTLMGQLNLNV